jgi:hypothetical protein
LIPRVGSALTLRVSAVHAGDNIQNCSWTSPEGVVYVVDKDKVTVGGTVA